VWKLGAFVGDLPSVDGVSCCLMYLRFQELEKNESSLPDDEEQEEGLKKNVDGEAEDDDETVDEDEYDEMELEEVGVVDFL